MSPSADAHSPLQQALQASLSKPSDSIHAAHLHHLAWTISHNLQHQHDWTALRVHTHSSRSNGGAPLPRPIVSGLPPKRAYIHPDEQAEIIKAEHEAGKPIAQRPEREWVLPTHVGEKWSVKEFAGVFDALDVVPPARTSGAEEEDEDVDVGEESRVGERWRGDKRQKRLLLATLHDDSTVVYYIMHDGIVKPRQN